MPAASNQNNTASVNGSSGPTDIDQTNSTVTFNNFE